MVKLGAIIYLTQYGGSERVFIVIDALVSGRREGPPAIPPRSPRQTSEPYLSSKPSIQDLIAEDEEATRSPINKAVSPTTENPWRKSFSR
jgi:hypothetical protein